MFGYACDQTPELMPALIVFAHRLVRPQVELRRSGRYPWLCPDAKSQGNLRFEDGHPVAIEAVVLSTQHAADADADEVRDAVMREIVEAVIPTSLRAPEMPPWLSDLFKSAEATTAMNAMATLGALAWERGRVCARSRFTMHEAESAWRTLYLLLFFTVIGVAPGRARRDAARPCQPARQGWRLQADGGQFG